MTKATAPQEWLDQDQAAIVVRTVIAAINRRYNAPPNADWVPPFGVCDICSTPIDISGQCLNSNCANYYPTTGG